MHLPPGVSLAHNTDPPPERTLLQGEMKNESLVLTTFTGGCPAKFIVKSETVPTKNCAASTQSCIVHCESIEDASVWLCRVCLYSLPVENTLDILYLRSNPGLSR